MEYRKKISVKTTSGKALFPPLVLPKINIKILNHPYEHINFKPAGFLAFEGKSGPLLQPYTHKHIFLIKLLYF